MDFDEYEYLEKTVEDTEDRDGSKKKKRDGTSEKSEKSYRKRDADEDIDNGDEERKRSKKSRDDDDERREKDRHKSSRDRDRERESERDRDRERGSREKDREREKERERERGSRERERDREKEKEKEKERRERERETRDKSSREREKERDRGKEDERERSRRSRSRSSRRHGSVEKERERERELREGEREIEMREHRRFRDKKETGEPEADPERDQRTVFAYQMPLKASDRDVYEFFSKAGKVRDVKLIMDRNSNRSKGVGNAILMRDDGNTLHSCLINSCCSLKVDGMYIEFYDAMSVPMAIALSGQLLRGQPVMVKPSEAEKNLVQSNTSVGGTGAATGPYGAVDRKLYVGNLHFNMTEIQLRQIFEPFGTVELVQLPLDLETGHCKGFGFVQFAQLESAKSAQSALNGQLEIAGRVIKVSSVTDHVGTQDIAPKSADFDDDDGGGLSLNAQSRAMLMQKLDRTGVASSIAGSLGVPGLNGPASSQPAFGLPINGQAATPVLPAQVFPSPASEPIGLPSECLLLKNMFDPATETEPDFDLDIKDDVEEECSKYGRVKHIHVDKNSAGFVYLRFETIEASANAQRAMHMRWFARRLISAIFMPPHEYEAKFRG